MCWLKSSGVLEGLSRMQKRGAVVARARNREEHQQRRTTPAAIRKRARALARIPIIDNASS